MGLGFGALHLNLTYIPQPATHPNQLGFKYSSRRHCQSFKLNDIQLAGWVGFCCFAAQPSDWHTQANLVLNHLAAGGSQPPNLPHKNDKPIC